jgi:hypothetical protein
MIESLLYSPLANDDRNLLFPNPEDPLAPPPIEVANIADIDTLVMCIPECLQEQSTCNHPNHVLSGIICYTDKLATGRDGHLSLEPA